MSAYNAGDPGSILGLGRSPGEGNCNPLQYSCLENSIEEPGGLQSMELQRVGHNWATEHTHNICITELLCCTAETNTTL